MNFIALFCVFLFHPPFNDIVELERVTTRVLFFFCQLCALSVKYDLNCKMLLLFTVLVMLWVYSAYSDI